MYSVYACIIYAYMHVFIYNIYLHIHLKYVCIYVYILKSSNKITEVNCKMFCAFYVKNHIKSI